MTGVAADFVIYRKNPGGDDRRVSAQNGMRKALEAKGATFFRMTIVTAADNRYATGLWGEGWKEQPAQALEFGAELGGIVYPDPGAADG